ncbi:cytochrome P450 6A1 [Xylariales sp. AK1849]|nr:cytochrome P450 6A1 [Xylariales sp. AK1849]
MAGVVDIILRPHDWPTSAWVLLLSGIATIIAQLAWRPSFGRKAPQLLGINSWPILGAWRYYTERYDFFKENQAASKTGNFSFYVGKAQVVAITGHEGRKSYFDSKELHMGAGYAALFAGAPSHPDNSRDEFGPWFSRTLVQLLKKENFVKNLKTLTDDTRTACEQLARTPASSADPKWMVFDPFDDLYNIVYKLTMRTVGAKDVAEDPALLKKTLSLFESLDEYKSTLRFFFPWLPTPNHLRRMYAGMNLYSIFGNIADERRKTGKREDDALQYLIDTGTNNTMILQFVVGSLFAGQINSGINAAWVPTYLAMHPEWKERLRAEVDGAIAKHRTSPDQSPADVLGTLTIEDWETEFKLIDLSLREAIRLGVPGTSFRRNISGRDVPIGKSGEVVPPDAYAIYLIDDVHLNPEIYTEPTKFDPGRYFEERAEDKRAPNAFAGWGLGRHPCCTLTFPSSPFPYSLFSKP